ncbi:hypothetical protein [Ligilactobacillus cholophilus]|uniref:hypothetical protein n=1 Tax=Ligilactobacillus cholophilus TaxID=3050131 RepID=UPI0025B170C0|nr:hypothetical protein [Ligilactobacillus cholophilus]
MINKLIQYVLLEEVILGNNKVHPKLFVFLQQLNKSFYQMIFASYSYLYNRKDGLYMNPLSILKQKTDDLGIKVG